MTYAGVTLTFDPPVSVWKAMAECRKEVERITRR
jgi:hypothetical protein